MIDSILDFDHASGCTQTRHADNLIATNRANDWALKWIIETHVHADHLSAAPYLAQQLGGKIAIGANISSVQEVFGKIFNAGTEFEMDGSQFDRLFADGDCFAIGNLDAVVMHTPGHTPACVTYVIGDAAFIGDTLFMPDFGTARADFPGGSATDLYNSIQRILALPDTTRLFLCHDYKTATRDTLKDRKIMRNFGEELLEASKAPPASRPQAFSAVRTAHDLVVEACHNEFSKKTMRVVQGLSRRFWIFHMKKEDFNIAAELHARLLLDVANGDTTAAISASNALGDYLEEFARETKEWK
ncbi:hypothetical protein AB838_16040 [Rhodobacteraceae bacterium (ex Bugula neritina AB1)]|nr:hypothetical protein AB838_16040 [Rhodobacteraceae bacterium (ex Bugula neritina AB1)]